MIVCVLVLVLRLVTSDDVINKLTAATVVIRRRNQRRYSRCDVEPGTADYAAEALNRATTTGTGRREQDGEGGEGRGSAAAGHTQRERKK